jgi:hypothetical protein
MRKPRTITSDRVKAEAPAARIVEKFGGLSRFCEICDFAHGTVHGWMTNGLIPAKVRDGMSYTAWIIAKAAVHEIELTAEDFIDQPGALIEHG